MKRQIKRLLAPGAAFAGLLLGSVSATWADGEVIEYDEFEPIIEINATDGDVGFHMLLDGEGWYSTRVKDPKGRLLMFARAGGPLGYRQGVTEFFLESAEPLCWIDSAADEDDEVVTVEQFLRRFKAGEYTARGLTLDDDTLVATGELTHNIPAAPIVEIEVDTEIDEDGDEELEVEISWESGEDLGRCDFPSTLFETHPRDVEVVRWEVVVEPDEDQLEEINEEREANDMDPIAFGVFSIQLPGDCDEIEVPEDWIEKYLEAGVTEFKGEVGAKEESGNQTFTEVEFEIGGDDEDDEDEDEDEEEDEEEEEEA